MSIYEHRLLTIFWGQKGLIEKWHRIYELVCLLYKILTEKVVSPPPELNQWTYCLIVLSELFYLKSARTHKKDWQKSLNNRISFSDKWTKRKSNYFWKRRWHRLRTSSWTSSLFAKQSLWTSFSFSSSEAPLLIFGVDNHMRSYAASTPMQLWRVWGESIWSIWL